MKITICVVFVPVLISCFAVGQSSKPTSQISDEEAIKRVVAQSDEYWNRHEFYKNAELRTDDSEGVNVVGQRQAGIASKTPP
jgi:hypothetical protein